MRDLEDFEFDGPFSEAIPLYVRHKRSCGFRVAEAHLYRLREIDLFFKKAGITEPVITQELYERWGAARNGERPVNTSRRRSALHAFAKYLAENGYTGIYLGENSAMHDFPSDYVPYIFTGEEIQNIFHILDESCRQNSGYAEEAFRAMFSMYYCCGFRKSEVVLLKVRDINFETGKVTIHDGKNKVARIVMMSDSLLSRIDEFRKKYHGESGPDTYFFHGTKNRDKPFCKATLYNRYHALLKEAGIPDRPDGRVHRLHDVRHTFCVYALEQMQEKGFDLYTSLPLLSTYLGHKHIHETEYYLRLIESRHKAVLEKAAAHKPGIFPKIGGSSDE